MDNVKISEDDIEFVIKPKKTNRFNAMNNGLYFTDQQRRIDIVLVYQRVKDNEANMIKRETFLKTLLKEGLEVEIQDEYGHLYSYDPKPDNDEEDDEDILNWATKIVSMPECEIRCNLVFIKVHATWDTLCRYAEVMKIRKPMLNLGVEYDFYKKRFFQRLFEKFDFLKVFSIDQNKLQPIPRGFTWPFSTSKEYLFDIPDEKSKFFTPAERSLIVNYILRRASFRRISGLKGLGNRNEPDLDDLEAAISDKAMDIEMGVITGTNVDDSPATQAAKAACENVEMTIEDEVAKAKISMDFGVAKLINDGVIESCYPLHEPLEGDLIINDEEALETPKSPFKGQLRDDNLRMLLYKNWVSMKNVFRLQPLDHIRLYFGEKVAFYFAWLGYYTYWLLPISFMGVLVTIFNIYNVFGDKLITDICNSHNITMCPLVCSSKGCKFWTLGSACKRFWVIRMLDNGVTVAMAVFTSIWASLFLEMWKRQQSRLAYHWCVHDMEYEDEPPRPEFVALIDKNYPRKVNQISGKEEPYIPFWRRRVPMLFFTYSTVTLSIALALGFLIGIILYKLVTGAIFRMTENSTISGLSNVLAAATGSMISVFIIMSLTLIYSRVATWLTDLEHHRTQSQYDSSVTLKLYLLEFVNNYSSIFYIGFIQPYTAPGPYSDYSTSVIKPKGCPAGGCLVELCMQLAFIMIGKQLISHAKEYVIPMMCSRLKVYRLKQSGRKLSLTNLANSPKKCALNDGETEETKDIKLPDEVEGVSSDQNNADVNQDDGDELLKVDKSKMTVNKEDIVADTEADGNKVVKVIHEVEPELVRCFSDNILADPGPRPLFSEYLEMLIQFGFMTIFIPAFPLAPLLALINNIFEVRSDALKFIKALKRPVAQRVNDIGIWISILTVVTRIAVKSNAFLIAFATTFIDRLTYKIIHNEDQSLDGFIKFSLSIMESNKFNLTRFGGDNAHLNTNSTYCKYFGYRHSPWTNTAVPYSYTPEFWQILAVKFIFIYLFENFVLLVMTIIAMVVPDIPDKLRVSMKREAVLTNEIILKAELLRHKNENASKFVATSFKKFAAFNKKPPKKEGLLSKMRNKQKWKGTATKVPTTFMTAVKTKSETPQGPTTTNGNEEAC